MPYALRSKTRIDNKNNNQIAPPSAGNQRLKENKSKKKDILKPKSEASPKISAINKKKNPIKSINMASESENNEINTNNKNSSNILEEESSLVEVESSTSSISVHNPESDNSQRQSTIESLQLRKVLIKNYIDIVNRIKLNTVPECLINLLHCKESHSENCDEPSMANYYMKSKIYLIKENRLVTFSKIVNLTTNSGCFWGNEIFFTIFRIILTVKPSEDQLYSPDYVIEEYSLLFENLIRTFPPCWKKLHPEYGTFMLSEIKTIDFLPQKPDSKMPNVLIFIINEIHEVCQEENNEPCTDETQMNNESSQFFNYNVWEAEQMKANSLYVHSREEKLNRLFICLQLINKIFEMDLSTWMVWKLLNPSDLIFTEDGPLVCRVFNITEFTFVTNSIKSFFQLFIKCVCCGYPKESIDIMERLLSLIATISNLADITPNGNNISYPKTGKMTDMFVDSFFKTMENIIGTNIQKYFTVIQTITLSFIKYKLINLLLIKIGSYTPKKFCLEVLYDDLSKYKWLECSESSAVQNEVSPTVGSKYPSLNVSKKTDPTDCYQNEYLKFLLEAIKSYCDFYCLNKFALILMNKPSELYLKSKTPYSFNSNTILTSAKILFAYNTIDKSELDTMLDSIDYSSMIDGNNAESNEIIEQNVLNIGLLTDEEQSTYLNDIHCMMKLQKNLLPLNKKYAGQFDEWCIYFDEFFPKPE